MSDGATMIVREARDGDILAIDAVSEAAYAEFAPRLEVGGWERMKQSLAVAALLAGGAVSIIAERGGRIAGSIAYYPPGRSDPRIFPSSWASLRALAVAPTARSQGIARRLTEACIERARRDGATVIGLHTSEAMLVARGLYERMGFVVVSELPSRFGLRYWLYRKDLD